MAYSDMILREAIVKTTKILSGQNVKVVMEGFAPRVAYNPATKLPEEIVLPTLPDNCPRDLLGAIHGYLNHEASHVMYSSPDDICDSSKDKVWHHIHNMIDDNRINAQCAADYPGTHIEIINGYKYLFDNFDSYKPEVIDRAFATDKKRAITSFLTSWIARKMDSAYVGPQYDASPLPKYFKELDDKLPASTLKELQNCKTSENVRDLTDTMYKFLEEYKEEMEKQIKKSEEESGKGKPQRGKPGDKDSEDGDGDPFDIPCSLEDGLKKAIERNIDAEFKKRNDTFFWSDRMNEIITLDDPKASNLVTRLGNNNLEEFDLECKQVSSFLRKRLERLLESRQRVYYVSGYKSGKMRGKNLYSVPLGNQNIFAKKNEIRAVNAAISLLVDLSGSMNGRKVRLASQCAYTMADCLDRIKIPFECLGFWTDSPMKGSRGDMYKEWAEFSRGKDGNTLKRVVNQQAMNTTMIFKDFHEGFGLRSKQALQIASNGGIGMANNEDATHINIALQRLAKMPQEKKVLFVFSDGQPAFSEQANNSRAKLKQLADAAMRDYGIVVVGIGITSDSVKHFYVNNKVINNLEELPESVFSILTNQLLNRK